MHKAITGKWHGCHFKNSVLLLYLHKPDMTNAYKMNARYSQIVVFV